MSPLYIAITQTTAATTTARTIQPPMLIERLLVQERIPLPTLARARFVLRSRRGSRMTNAPRKRLLIVDDEPLIIEVLSEHFKPTYDIETATNGTDALTAVLRARLDAILLDINMPRMNGVEVLKDIKKIDDSIPVIMVTANEQIALAADALKTGAFRYLDHMVATIFDRFDRPRPVH